MQITVNKQKLTIYNDYFAILAKVHYNPSCLQMWENGLEIRDRNTVGCKAPSDFGKLSFTDTKLYTLGSLYVMVKESEVHIKIYGDMQLKI